jgi:glutaredoxin
MSASDVTLYTRRACHLCDEAADVLAKHGLHPKKVDIDGDAELSRRYTNCVPVVVIDGKERFRGRVDETLLKRLLRVQAEDHSLTRESQS